MDNEARLYAELEARSIAYKVVEHHAVFTVDESQELNASLPGAHTKNLFLRDNDRRFWLVTVPGEIRVNLKALPATIGSKRLSFGKAEDLLRLLGLTPGSVTPLGAINDAAGEVQVVLERDLAATAIVWVHPLRNSASLGIAGCDLVKLLTGWNHKPQIAEVPHLSEIDAA